MNEIAQLPVLWDDDTVSSWMMERYDACHHAGYLTEANQARRRRADARAREGLRPLAAFHEDLTFQLFVGVVHPLASTNLSPAASFAMSAAPQLSERTCSAKSCRTRPSSPRLVERWPGENLRASSCSRCTATRETTGRARARFSPSIAESTPTLCGASTPRIAVRRGVSDGGLGRRRRAGGGFPASPHLTWRRRHVDHGQ